MKILEKDKIWQMEVSDFERIFNQRIKLLLTREVEILEVNGKEFIGYITGLKNAETKPTLPGGIKFINEKNYHKKDQEFNFRSSILVEIFEIKEIIIL